MFWGLIMEPNKRYTQTVERPFHVSMATLDISTSDDEPVQVMLCYEGRNYLLCNLSKKQTCQATLDLNFQEGTKISFTSNGSGHVHLTGYLVPEDDMDDMDDLDEMDEQEDEEEDEEEVPQLVGKQLKRKATDNNIKEKLKKLKTLEDCLFQNGQDDSSDSDNVIEEEGEEEDDDDEEEGDMELEFEDDDDDDDNDEDVDDEEEGEEEEEEEEDDDDDDEEEEEEKVEEVKPKGKQNQQQQKNQKQQKDAKDKAVVVNGKDTNQQKKNKKEQQQQAKATQEVKPEVKQQQAPKKQVLGGGIVIEELKVGSGAPAVKGKFISVYYIGKLKNGKKFDATQSGKGFKFRLGSGEVIKGWDIGLMGMKVGGKRRVTVPPAMGYGKKGSPPVIPGNSVLVFDVELKEVH